MMEGKKKQNNSEDISVNDVRSSLYDQYRHEIDAIWRNSQFAWTFEAFLFGAYGILAKEGHSLFIVGN